jgi:hypothetical protein
MQLDGGRLALGPNQGRPVIPEYDLPAATVVRGRWDGGKQKHPLHAFGCKALARRSEKPAIVWTSRMVT